MNEYRLLTLQTAVAITRDQDSLSLTSHRTYILELFGRSSDENVSAVPLEMFHRSVLPGNKLEISNVPELQMQEEELVGQQEDQHILRYDRKLALSGQMDEGVSVFQLNKRKRCFAQADKVVSIRVAVALIQRRQVLWV
jgi:hypothetical protein